MSDVSLKTIHKDLSTLKKEVHEIKALLKSEPELREDVVKKINEARERVKTDFVPHEQMKREFMAE